MAPLSANTKVPKRSSARTSVSTVLSRRSRHAFSGRQRGLRGDDRCLQDRLQRGMDRPSGHANDDLHLVIFIACRPPVTRWGQVRDRIARRSLGVAASRAPRQDSSANGGHSSASIGLGLVRWTATNPPSVSYPLLRWWARRRTRCACRPRHREGPFRRPRPAAAPCVRHRSAAGRHRRTRPPAPFVRKR